ncbi:hypothetical protein P3L51_11710 [Streptomyces sp. PSRA5]|uniref:hypothetical protein n=1 Tax=Streptomyces panacea TaxID=3035064 RepID=UPI00339CCFA2
MSARRATDTLLTAIFAVSLFTAPAQAQPAAPPANAQRADANEEEEGGSGSSATPTEPVLAPRD